jgi:hypothetical protein
MNFKFNKSSQNQRRKRPACSLVRDGVIWVTTTNILPPFLQNNTLKAEAVIESSSGERGRKDGS